MTTITHATSAMIGIRIQHDAGHLAQLRKLPCCLCGVEPAGEVHHHTGRRGIGQKRPDYDAIPLCWWCHMDFHNARGAFRDWDKARRRQWQDEMVERYRPVVRPDVF